MSETPLQTILQQRDARPVPGEHLEVLGKKAASEWVMGKHASLNAAIVETVRGERLSPEQVLRVVEFTNQDAYIQEFRKESSHKVVHFDCGPADPGQVLQDLNDGGGGSVYDRGTLDYSRSPREVHKEASVRVSDEVSTEKTAAAANESGVPGLPKLTKLPALPKTAGALDHYEDQLWAAFGNGRDAAIPYANPLQPLIAVRDKLAGARDHLATELDMLEADYSDAGSALYHQVKQAALDGTSLSDVVASWAAVSEDPIYTKVAFSVLTPRLRRDGVFSSFDAIGESLAKTASIGEVNMAHPMVESFAAFVEVLNKLASVRALHNDFAEGADQADALLKEAASGGLVGAAKKGLSAASKHIDSASPTLARLLVGEADAEKLAPTLAKGLKATGLTGGVLVGNAALQSVTDRPMVRAGTQAVESIVPGTAAYQNRRYNTMMGQ